MSASAAIASPARPIRIPVPLTVPPRRRVPAASGTPPSPPSTPPIAPPSASFQSPIAKPTALPPAAPIRIASSAPGRVLASQAAATTATPAPIPAATPIRYHSHIRSSVVLESWLPAGLEAADHRESELGRSRAVDHAVVDDRGRQQAAELAGARDGERRASELLGFELVGARRFGEPCDLVSQLVDGARVAVADDRDDEPLVGLHGDAEVVAVEVDDLVALEPSVQLGHLFERLGHGLERHGDEPLQIDGAEVALLDPRDGRYLGVGPGHVLCDQLPDTAQPFAASLRAVSRGQTPGRGRGAHVLFGHAALRPAA